MKRLGGLIAGALVLLLLLLLLVPLAGRFFGTDFRALEMATGPEPQYFLVALFLFVAALCTRKKAIIVLAGITLLFHGLLVIPWYFGKKPASGESLKVVSFNVLHANRRYDEVVKWVIEQAPQVAVFQEVTTPWPAELQKLRKEFPFHYRVDVIQMDVFSKLPIERPYFEKYGTYRGFICFEVHVGGPVMIYATHTYPQIHFGLEGFRFHRDHLIKGLPADIAKHRGTPVIVLGDLNSTMWSPHYRALVKATGLENARKGFGIFPSLGNEKNWKPWTALAFDHCLVSADIGVEDFRTGPFLGSDHLPIVAKLRVPLRKNAPSPPAAVR